MNEKNISLEIKQQNAKALEHAVGLVSEQLLNMIVLPQQSESRYAFEPVHAISPMSLIDRDGNSLAAELVTIMTYSSWDDPGTHGWRLALILAPAGKLRVSAYLEDITDFDKDIEIGARTWKLTETKTQELPALYATSYSETSRSYQGFGVGSVLVQKGEQLKDRVAHKVAQQFGLKQITTITSDDSDGSWATKQVLSLGGYKLQPSAEGNVRQYEKVVEIDSKSTD